jgi:hypothetical protein
MRPIFFKVTDSGNYTNLTPAQVFEELTDEEKRYVNELHTFFAGYSLIFRDRRFVASGEIFSECARSA